MAGPAMAERTPLGERLQQLIRLKGPITVADFMTDALSHPHDGYYMSQTAIGADGDFTTAPEISQIFGELIGAWLIEAWQGMGEPAEFNLIELGPGRGVLMEDILRTARLRPRFLEGAQVWLLETSGRMRVEQQKRLRASGVKPLWADEFADMPPAPSLIVANEFFDCLPVRQFVRTKIGWRERMVGLDDKGALAFVNGDVPPPPDYGLPPAETCAIGDIFEINFAARDFMEEIAQLLRAEGGAALIIDYGHIASGLGDTLQAVRAHQYAPPLAAPGKADLTAHVDFAALSAIAIDAGVSVYGPIAQGQFLNGMGLPLRTEMLCKDKPQNEQARIRAGATRIAAPDQMGEIFKVMAVTGPDEPAVAGFDDL
ncbi:MAG: SAM-dependent methyltransferase [Pseudomonadota bacterium]